MGRHRTLDFITAKTAKDKLSLLNRLLHYLLRYRKRLFFGLLCMVMASMFHVSSIGLLKPMLQVMFSGVSEQTEEIGLSAVPPLPSEGVVGGLRSWLSRQYRIYMGYLLADRMKGVLILGAVLVAIVLMRGGFDYLQNYMMRWVSYRMTSDLRLEVYHHINSLPLDFFSRRGTGTLMAHMTSDIDLFAQNVELAGSSLIKPFEILFILGGMFFLHFKMTIIGLFVFPVAAFIIGNLSRRVRRASRKRQEFQAGVSSILQETFSGVRLVRSFGMEGYEEERFAKEVFRLFRSNMRIARARALSPVLIEGMGAAVTALGLATGAYFVLRDPASPDYMSPENFFTYIGFAYSLYQPMKEVSKISLTLNNALAGAERVFSILDTEVLVRENENAVSLDGFHQGIEYREVVFEYPGGVRALDGVSLEIKRGETVALVGPSGAGKSTFVDLLARFYDVCDGSIEIDGRDVRDLRIASLRSLIGFVPQEVVLFNDTVRNNIAYGRPDLSIEAVEAAARESGAHEFIVDLPNGYDTIVGERGHSLSGGQCQRLSIARALVKNPPILIFDEATSSLDSESERKIQWAMQKLIRNRTTVIIAHRLSTILHSDKIAVMDRGKMVSVGSHAELLETCEIYQRLYRLQFEQGEASAIREEDSSQE